LRLRPCDGALLEMLHLVPAQPQDLGGPRAVGLKHYVDRKALKKKGEARPRFCPRDPRLAHPVLRAFHARNARMKKGLKLARIKVPPRALFGVVIDGTADVALRAAEFRARLVLDPNPYLALSYLQLHPSYGERRPDAKNLRVEFGVLHPGRLHRSASKFPATHGEAG
jgi:hypothetical protein